MSENLLWILTLLCLFSFGLVCYHHCLNAPKPESTQLLIIGKNVDLTPIPSKFRSVTWRWISPPTLSQWCYYMKQHRPVSKIIFYGKSKPGCFYFKKGLFYAACLFKKKKNKKGSFMLVIRSCLSSGAKIYFSDPQIFEGKKGQYFKRALRFFFKRKKIQIYTGFPE